MKVRSSKARGFAASSAVKGGRSLKNVSRISGVYHIASLLSSTWQGNSCARTRKKKNRKGAESKYSEPRRTPHYVECVPKLAGGYPPFF
jgi:hypothetical protein